MRALLAFALFGLNAFLCWPLFHIEYLNDLHTNEGAFITLGKFLLDHWPHTSWFPLFNMGTSFEYTYQPLVPYLVAISSAVTRYSPAHVFHFLAALGYSLAPVFLFLFAYKVSRRLAPSFWAALMWSLLAPSVLIRPIWVDMDKTWGLRRLKNIVFWGETPHNLALCLAPLALLLVIRFWDAPCARRFAVAVLAVAAVMLTNAFGGVVTALSMAMLIAVEERWRRVFSSGAILAMAYLLTCVSLPPSLIWTIHTNSQLMAAGDFQLTHKTQVAAVLFVLGLAVLWAVARRIPDVMLRFAILFTACFGGITLLAYGAGIGFVPQPARYHIEMEAGICLLVAFAAALALDRVPRTIRVAVAALSLVALAWVALRDYHFARGLIQPLDITTSAPYREARWIGEHLPGQRVLVSGEGEYWFNLFTDNPQLSAGAVTTEPDWMQEVAVYTIYSGQNSGEQDGPVSVFWLKAFGCGAITVPGRGSADPYHAIRNPEKFEGLLPRVWREGPDSIYQVPLRSTSLAHVIPAAAVVTRRPIHGLDIQPVRAYVSALDDPALPAARLEWDNPDRGRIMAKIEPGQVVSLQITHDVGWQATSGGQAAPIHADQLGLMILEPHCSGDCTIELKFTGGWERNLCLALSVITGLLLFGMLIA